MHWYTDVLKKYAVFSGRATRKEYWMFFLWNVIISFFLGAILGVFTGAMNLSKNIGEIVQNLYGLVLFLPSLGVTFRRLHDTGRSGWLAGGELILITVFTFIILGSIITENNTALPLLISLFIFGVIVYSIILLVFLVKDSYSGENKYGPNPKGITPPNAQE